MWRHGIRLYVVGSGGRRGSLRGGTTDFVKKARMSSPEDWKGHGDKVGRGERKHVRFLRMFLSIEVG